MITDRFEVPARLRNTGLMLTLIGVLTIAIGAFTLLINGDGHTDLARFWSVLLHNSVYFLMITVAAIFIQAAAALAQGGWIVGYRRVPEAIGANVWVFGLIAFIILMCCVFLLGDHNPIFHWVNPGDDKVLQGKSPFLNKPMFVGFTVVAIALWSYFGLKFQKLSLEQEKAPRNSTKIYWKVVSISGVFLLVYGLTMMSTTPWFWIMSIDAHWYSTLFSWYVFASSFVSGIALILIWTVYLKNRGNLFIVTKEHMHDLGKFMFAFSIFWTYTWFSQFMLIWYANIPEETIYFKIRMQGPYSFLFYLNLVVNFVLPLLVLMTAPSKHNYYTLVIIAMLIIFGHWVDFYLMIMPGPLGEHWFINWYEVGVLCGFIGVLILVVSKTLAKHDLITQNNPLLKETIIHVS